MTLEQFEAISALFVPPGADEDFEVRLHR